MFLAKYQNKIVLAAMDMLSLTLSGLLGLYLRFDGSVKSTYYSVWTKILILAIPVYFVVYFFFGLYRRIWRYASARDLANIAVAVTIATASLTGIVYLNPGTSFFPRSVVIMSWFVNTAAVGGIRFSFRVASDSRKSITQRGRKPTLIIGAGDAGRLLVEEVARHPELDYRIIGFLDDDPKKAGYSIAGVPVLGVLAILEQLVAEQGITDITIAMPSASVTTVKEIVQRCSALGIKPKIVPGLYRVLNGATQMSSVRDVQIEDLLPRPEIKMDFTEICQYISGKTVLVTGAGGSIGSELSRQAANFGVGTLLLLGHGENSIYEIHRELKRVHPDLNLVPIIADVQDKQRIEAVFQQHQPHVVFHAAAHKHVPLMEYNPTEALKNNVIGTKNVAEAADEYHAGRFVMISTDKAVNPTSVMGATKRITELIIQSINQRSQTKFVAVRFGNVLGSRGSVVPLFKEQIAHGGPVTVTHQKITRYFMTIPEAVSLVIQAGSMGTGGEVFVLDMGSPVKIVDLARDLITLSGLKPDEDIKIEFTGIRPGEKMFEEVLTAEEGTSATRHERIYTARQFTLNKEQFDDLLNQVSLLAMGPCQPEDVIGLVASVNRNIPLYAIDSQDVTTDLLLTTSKEAR